LRGDHNMPHVCMQLACISAGSALQAATQSGFRSTDGLTSACIELVSTAVLL